MKTPTVIITSTFAPNKFTQRMRESFERFGYEVADMKTGAYNPKLTAKELYEGMKRAATGHELFCYSDAADTICQREFEVPEDHIVFAAEKALWPLEDIKDQYPKVVGSRWKYLNGGMWGGPLELMIEFWDKYRIPLDKDGHNAQHQWHLAFIAAKKDKFPVKLDTKCKIFQCIAHNEPEEFNFDGKKGGLVKNLITKSTPAIIHGNGQTDMEWVEKMVL